MACGGGDATGGGESDDDASGMSWDACPFELPRTGVRCGTFAAATASETGGTAIELPVVRLEGEDPRAEPTVFLTGGPGESALSYLPDLASSPSAADAGDLIVVEQRGNSWAEPALTCPEASGLEDSAGLAACRDRLVAGGVTLDDYDTSAVVDDLHRLRAALRYERWNVYAVSYGTRVALEYLRRYPADVGRVVLDSPYPPTIDNGAHAPAALLDQLDALLESCRDHAGCTGRAEIDRADVESVVQSLNVAPATAAAGGTVTGQDFATRLFGALAETSMLPVIPQAISLAADGDVEAALELLTVPDPTLPEGYPAVDLALGLQLSVLCQDEVPFDSSAAAPVATAAPWSGPMQSSALLLQQLTQRACRIWSVPPSEPAQGETVTSDAETLVLVGEFDPVTPPAYAALAASGLPNSRAVVVPATSHYTTAAGCGRELARRFLTGGASATSCPPASPWS